MRPLQLLLVALAAAAVLAAAAFVAACGSSSTAMPGSTSAGNASDGALVGLGSTSLGQVLVDAQGKTLYLWAHDTADKSTCSGECAEYWPPLLTDGKPEAATGADASLLGTSRRADGGKQVTYAGHPLYYFVKDTKPGQTSGEGLTGFGGRWDPVSAMGTAVQSESAMASDPYSADTLEASSGSSQAIEAAFRTPVALHRTQSGPPVRVRVFSPRPHAIAGAGGTFSVDLALEARRAAGNRLLQSYKPGFIDPNSPEFHPGPNANAPGLVVLLSTTPTIAGTPLQGPNTNLAGVFQINDVSRLDGLKRTLNSWLVGVPGFFGQNNQATLTVFAVRGTAPAIVDLIPRPISNIVHETFTIAP